MNGRYKVRCEEEERPKEQINQEEKRWKVRTWRERKKERERERKIKRRFQMQIHFEN
jgi:hypothetical protein